MKPDCGHQMLRMEVEHIHIKSTWRQNSRFAPVIHIHQSLVVTPLIVALTMASPPAPLLPNRNINLSASLTIGKPSLSSLQRTSMTSVRWSARPTTLPSASTPQATSRTPWRARSVAWSTISLRGDGSHFIFIHKACYIWKRFTQTVLLLHIWCPNHNYVLITELQYIMQSRQQTLLK